MPLVCPKPVSAPISLRRVSGEAGRISSPHDSLTS